MNPAPPAASPNPNSEPPRADRGAAGPSPSRGPAATGAPAGPERRSASDRRTTARGGRDEPAASRRTPARASRGRSEPEQRPACTREDDRAERGPRDAFQRDRDRIIHSIPFRRLRHKTQVFVAPDGDHYRVRLTHSLEVAQIARTLARALGLNEDLTEALALAHDIGHPPFGHAGEDVLQAAMAEAGGFDHNAHTIRLLTRLESPYPRFAGLNLELGDAGGPRQA